MTVLRIVPNFQANHPGEAARFYGELFGLDRAMDMGWIVTLTSPTNMTPQMSLMREGGSGTEVPDISVEVDDVDAAHARAKNAGFEIAYTLVDELWGVRRFFVRDPQGRTVNILSHSSK